MIVTLLQNDDHTKSKATTKRTKKNMFNNDHDNNSKTLRQGDCENKGSFTIGIF